MSVDFGRTMQNSFPSGVSEHGPRLSAGLTDLNPAGAEPCPEPDDALDLRFYLRDPG